MNDVVQSEASNFRGEWIRKAREEHGLTLSQLAERADISRTYLWQVESDRSQPSYEVVAKIAAALGLSVAQLAGDSASHIDELIQQEENAQQNILNSFLPQRASVRQMEMRYAEMMSSTTDFQVAISTADKIYQGINAGLANLTANDLKAKPVNQCAKFILEATTFERKGKESQDPTADYEEAIRAYRHAREYAKDLDVAAYIDWNLGNLLADSYRYREAIDHLFRAASRLEGQNLISPGDLAWLRTSIGYLSYRQGHYKTALGQFEKASKLWELLGKGYQKVPEKGRSPTLRGLGSIHERLGRFAEANQYLSDTLASANDEGSRVDQAWANARLGFLYIRTGNWAEAESKMAQAEKLRAELMAATSNRRNLRLLKAIILNNMGLLYLRKGQVDRALAYSSESLDESKQIPDLRSEAFAHLYLAFAYGEQGRDPEALEHLSISQEQFDSMGVEYYMPEIKAFQAEIYSKLGLIQSAFPAIEQAIKITTTEETGSPLQEAIVRRTAGFVYAMKSEQDEQDKQALSIAKNELEQSITLLTEIGDPYELAKAHLVYAGVMAKQEQSGTGREHLVQAQKLCSILGAASLLMLVELELTKLG